MQIVMAMYLLICFITYTHKMILWDFFLRKYLSEQHWQMRHIRLHGCICFREETSKSSLPIFSQYKVGFTGVTVHVWGGWVRQRCHVSYVTGASNWYWLTVGQFLLSGRRVEGRMVLVLLLLHCHSFSFFPCLFLSSPLLSLFSLSARQHKMTHKGWRVIKPQLSQSDWACLYNKHMWLWKWKKKNQMKIKIKFNMHQAKTQISLVFSAVY